MIKKITIKNIKHIKKLEFNLPSSAGVYTLTGTNGSGKTTLMTTLLRIGWFRAFQDYFKTGKEKFDLYKGEIIYQVENKQVSYHHAGTRWPPRPRKNSKLFNNFGYCEVRFLPATGNRLYIQNDEISSSRIKSVQQELIDNLNSILDTNKFTNLKYVQTGSLRGPGSGNDRWKRAYVIKLSNNNYYSEKNFSLGEILILNTLLLIEDIKNNSMLLIDELEMVLHPRVQIRLYNYLIKKAEEKNLTIILSTHSSSIIKVSEKIIFLENNGNGTITTHYNCYPAMVLKEVAIEEDIQPDYIFTVEDDMATMPLNEMINLYFSVEPSKRSICKILPIGGYKNVLEFSKYSKDYLFHSKIGQYIFLDLDVKDIKDTLSTKGNQRTQEEQKLFELFNLLSNRIHYLPITPELGIWNWLNDQKDNIQSLLLDYYTGSTFNLSDLLYETNTRFSTSSTNIRKNAKFKLKYLTKKLESILNEDSKRINQHLFKLFVEEHFKIEDNLNKLKSTFGQIFSIRGN